MSDGTILELVSRGKKDAYQIQDPVRSWFGTPYQRRSPSTQEVRLLYPENQPRFGQWFDVVIPPDGDMLMSLDLRITMPTWLPPAVAAINPQASAYKVEVASDPYSIKSMPYANLQLPPTVMAPLFPVEKPSTPLQYGWCDGIANNLIERWVLYADNIVVLTGYGEFNTWFPDLENTHNLAPVYHAATGRVQQNIEGSLQGNATLGELVFRVPIPGCQHRADVGFPICSLAGKKVFIRFWLRDKKALVNSSQLPPLTFGPTNYVPPPERGTPLPMYEIDPTPWGLKQVYVNGSTHFPDGSPCGRTLIARDMGHPYIYARCAVLNVESELRKSLQTQKYEIRFHQQLRDVWTVDARDFVAGAPDKHLLMINGLFQLLFVGFRSDARTRQNRYLDILPSLGDWLTTLSLVVNGAERIFPWDPKKFRTLANNTQLARDMNIALYYLVFGIAPDSEPGGACNLARCQKAMINFIFNAVPPDPMTGTNVTYGFVVGKAWNILDIDGATGLVSLRFSN